MDGSSCCGIRNATKNGTRDEEIKFTTLARSCVLQKNNTAASLEKCGCCHGKDDRAMPTRSQQLLRSILRLPDQADCSNSTQHSTSSGSLLSLSSSYSSSSSDAGSLSECRRRPLHQRAISFDSVQIRRYSMCLGDNPCCSVGIPVTLSWEYQEELPVNLDLYEREHGRQRRRRKLRDLVLNAQERHDILLHAGYSESELEVAEREVRNLRRKRIRTTFFLPVFKVEEIFLHSGHKMQEFFLSLLFSRRSRIQQP